MIGIFFIPVRICVFIIGWFAYWMEVTADWVTGVRKKTEYVRMGACKRCGCCCRCLALIMPKEMSRHDRLVKIVELWHRVAMNFCFIDEEDGWLVYRCGYFRDGPDNSPGHCSIYPFRHRLCRFFPRQRLYGHLSLHKDCGFRFVRRDVYERNKEARASKKTCFSDLLRPL